MMTVDACQSGGLFKSNEKNSKVGRPTSHPNGIIISSCQPNQNAFGVKLVKKNGDVLEEG